MILTAVEGVQLELELEDPLGSLDTLTAKYCGKREQILWRTSEKNMSVLTGKGIQGIKLIDEEEVRKWIRQKSLKQ